MNMYDLHIHTCRCTTRPETMDKKIPWSSLVGDSGGEEAEVAGAKRVTGVVGDKGR